MILGKTEKGDFIWPVTEIAAAAVDAAVDAEAAADAPGIW